MDSNLILTNIMSIKQVLIFVITRAPKQLNFTSHYFSSPPGFPCNYQRI